LGKFRPLLDGWLVAAEPLQEILIGVFPKEIEEVYDGPTSNFKPELEKPDKREKRDRPEKLS